MNPLLSRWLLLPLLLALAGCAAQREFQDGEALLAQGRTAEALARFEEAGRLEPGSAAYRAAALRTRDRLLTGQIDQAEGLRARGQLDAAEQGFRQALALKGNDDRALDGLRKVDQERRLARWLQEAERALPHDGELARARLRAILLESPGHPGARSLLQRLEEPAARPPGQAALAAAYRKQLSIEFKDVPVRTVFEVIARTSGMNFVFDKDVRGDQKTSIFLKNSTIENAVQLTLLTNQLEQRVLDSNTVLIYPNTQAKQKDYQPLTVRSFYLANAEAKVVAATLKALLKSRDVVVDEKLNLVILRDSPEAVRLAEKLVALHDVPEPEVMLEVEILEVKRSRLLDLGIRWPDQLSLAPLPVAGGTLTLSNLRNLNSATTAASVGALTLNARKTDSDANILANPRIRTRNREKAKVLIGERVPNITTTSTATGFVSESVNYVDVGLKLEVEPTISLDGEVAIKIALEVSNIIREVPTKSGSVAYQIGTRNAQTVLRLRDGENQVLAGLLNDEERRSANRVPGLGEVPVVGRLFGSQVDDGSKTEVVLSITPRIVRNLRRPDAGLMEFDSGTESSLGARPMAGGAAAAPAPASVPASPAASSGQSIAPASGSVQTAGSTSAASEVNTTPAPAVASAVQAVSAQSSGAASGTVLRWQGPTQVKAGDLFALQIQVHPDQPLASLPFTVTYDPALLQITSVAEGDFLRQGGVPASFASQVADGRIAVTGARTADTGATAPGTLATINFRALAATAGTARLEIISASPVASNGRPAPAATGAAHELRVLD